MLLKILFIFSFFISQVLISPQQIFAVGPSENQNWQCLNSSKVEGHKVTLSTKPNNPFFPPGAEVYVVECLSTETGDICTTGEEATDKQIFGPTNTNLKKLQTIYNYNRSQFTGTQPTKSDNAGNIGPFVWQSDLTAGVGHSFWGVSFLPPAPITDYNPSLQLGTFVFQNANSKCDQQRWDPYGRVFDSVSLEPIGGVTVTLNERTSGTVRKYTLTGLTNPVRTRADGAFTFVVPDAIYLLKPEISSHSFPNIPSQLNPNYIKAYSDVYRGEDIIQSGQIQHRDIPLDAIGAPFRSVARIMNYSIQLDKVNSAYVVSGAISHPASFIQLYNSSSLKAEVKTDNYGVFEIVIAARVVDPALPLSLRVRKVDLTQKGASLFEKLNIAVFAQEGSTEIVFDSIPNYLEGYTYIADANSNDPKIAPNANVYIYLVDSTVPFYMTKSDQQGFIKIPSQHLPSLPYTIKIITAEGTSRNYTTTQFAEINSTFIEKENVKYEEFKPDVQVTGNPIIDKNYPTDNQTNSNLTQNQSANVKDLNRQAAIIALVLIAIFSAGAAVYYFRKKMKKS